MVRLRLRHPYLKIFLRYSRDPLKHFKQLHFLFQYLEVEPSGSIVFIGSTMCILFIYNGTNVEESDYSLILAANRDEHYDRPSQNMAPWSDDSLVFGGRDLEPNRGEGTWLALSPARGKIGVLLNIPNVQISYAESRGKLVADFVRSDKHTKEYIDDIKPYAKECHEFVLVSAEFGSCSSTVFSYSNANDKLSEHKDTCLAFGNSLPDTPLKKVEAGRFKMKDICDRLNKVTAEKELIQKLIELLKSDERHLPDHQLEISRPEMHNELSSIFVSIPSRRYGTRTHTIVLVTKKGHVNVIELTMQSPVDLTNVKWERTEFQFHLDSDRKV